MANQTNITENNYIEMAEDCRKRIEEKNKVIKKLQECILMCWALLTQYSRVGDETYIEDLLDILGEELNNNFRITED